MKKQVTAAITTVALMAGSFVPVIPQSMQLQYSYEYTYPTVNPPFSTSTGPFPDDGTHKVYASVFQDSSGQLATYQITAEQYKKMGRVDGQKFNPDKSEYKSLFQAITPKADALITKDSVASAANTGTGASSLTISHTIASGAVEVVCVSGAISNKPVSVTYNGAALATSSELVSTYFAGQYYTGSPTSGTHNIVVTFAGSNRFGVAGLSLLGANTATPQDAANSNGGTSGNPVLATVTTTVANDWLVSCNFSNGAGGSDAANSPTVLQTHNHNASDNVSLNQASNPDLSVGSNSTSLNLTAPGATWVNAVMAVQPAAAASTANFGTIILFQ